MKIPLNTTVAPVGTLRLILRGGQVEVHYQIDAAGMPTSQRPAGTRHLGVDKGYTEALVDSDGDRHGTGLGELLTVESDRVKERNVRRAKLRSIANTTTDRAKADRIRRHNLGTLKRDRQAARHNAQVRTEIFAAVHRVVDKATVVVAEDLTATFAGRKPLGRTMNRRLAGWTKGVTAEALRNVSERRGSALVLVNAAYTSQACPDCGGLGRRRGTGFTAPGAGSCTRQTTPPRSTSCTDTAIPTSPCNPTDAGQADPAGTGRSPPDQTAGPGLKPPHGGGERTIHQRRSATMSVEKEAEE